MLVPPPVHPGPRPPPRRSGRGGMAPLPPPAPFGSRTDRAGGGRVCQVVGTADGGLGVLLPLDERVYRSLSLLQQIMAIGVRTTCSLNPRDFRSIKTRAFRAEKKRGVLDGTLLWRYPSLPLTLQNDLAAVIGTTPDSILESLTKLDTFLSFF